MASASTRRILSLGSRGGVRAFGLLPGARRRRWMSLFSSQNGHGRDARRPKRRNTSGGERRENQRERGSGECRRVGRRQQRQAANAVRSGAMNRGRSPRDTPRSCVRDRRAVLGRFGVRFLPRLRPARTDPCRCGPRASSRQGEIARTRWPSSSCRCLPAEASYGRLVKAAAAAQMENVRSPRALKSLGFWRRRKRVEGLNSSGLEEPGAADPCRRRSIGSRVLPRCYPGTRKVVGATGFEPATPAPKCHVLRLSAPLCDNQGSKAFIC